MPKISSPQPKFHIVVEIKIRNEYLCISPATVTGKKAILKEAQVAEEDLSYTFWGSEEIRRVCDLCGLSPKERMDIHKGTSLKKYVKRSLVEEWSGTQEEYRLHRERVIEEIEEVSKALHKLFLKDKRLHKKAKAHVKSDILPFMDGSALLWLNVVLSSKKDFLRFHGDPRRATEWENLKPEDLIEEDGSIKRGNDDAWQYLTSRDFLLDDNYEIDIGDPLDGKNKAVNLEQLLSWLVETCQGRSLDSSIINPSVKRLRAELAHASGDPKLIAIYYSEELLEE